jgi:hypothetical protein
MGKKMTDNTSWHVFDPQARKILLSTLRLLTSSVPTLTVLLLLHDGAADETTELPQQEMAVVEEMLRSDLRRSDAVLHCGPACSAALLIGADADGACAVTRRLHQTLSACAEVTLPLSLGWAASSQTGHEAEALVTLALEGRRPFLPVADETLFVAARAAKTPAKEGLGQVFDAYVLTGAMLQPGARRKGSLAPGAEVPERPVVAQVRARARELGVPYLAPPRSIPSSVRKLVPLEVMRQYRCLPVGRNRNALTVALADPTDTGALLRLEEMTGLTIFPVMTDPEALEHLAYCPGTRRAAQRMSQA